MEFPFLHDPPSGAFRRRRIVLPPCTSRPYDAAEWRDALVVVEHGTLHLECRDGGVRTVDEGAVLTLDGLALRALHNRGPDRTVLLSASRRPPRRPA